MQRRSVLWICLLALALAVPSTDAKPLTDAERERLLQHLGQTRQALIDAVAGLSKAQWAYKPAEDRWSVAECAEHLAMAEQFIHQNIVEVLQSPAVADPPPGKEDEILKVIVDRSQKFQAPAPVTPEDRWGGKKKATMKAFKSERDEVLELVTEAEDLRSYIGPHPAFGDLDAYGWLMFLSGHTQRHIAQIEEVKADPGFPRR